MAMLLIKGDLSLQATAVSTLIWMLAGFWGEGPQGGWQLVAARSPHPLDDLHPHCPALVVYGAPAAAHWPGSIRCSHDSHVPQVSAAASHVLVHGLHHKQLYMG